ncbi:YqzE family protein [Oceanobacillus sp. CAU 1775]
MSTNNYLRYLTEELTKYYNQPKEERKMKRKEKGSESKSFYNTWFGIIPFSFRILIKK